MTAPPDTAQSGRAPTSEPLALERNLALMAGAGAGKTYSLITICLHLLGGARRSGVAVKPAELFLLTFTEKAAGEMRARLRARVDRLVRDPNAAKEEKELSASFEHYQRPLPPLDFWRRVRDDLGAATIGTFHSLCVQLLRRAPAGFGVDPAFDLLEEGESRRILNDAAERVVLEAIEREDAGVVELCRDLAFTGQGRGEGVVTALCSVFTKVREEGLSPARLPITDAGQARGEFDAAVARFRDQLQIAIAADATGQRRFGEVLGRIARCAEGLAFDNFPASSRWPALKAAIESEDHLGRQREEIKRVKFLALGKKDEDLIGLHGYFAACTVAKQEAAFRELLTALQARYRAELDKRAVLDFSELLIRTRNLLRDVPTVRREVQDRVRALLVDEFQDTNRLQLELVTLLAERREGAPRLVHDGAEESGADEGVPQLGLALDARRGRGIGVDKVPLEPGLLAAVGDRKQSIYEFRGADVSVFEVLAQQIEKDGGARAFLQTNRRSSPALIDFFNATFARTMGRRPDARDYEVAYVPESDDLRAHRRQRTEPPVVERLVYVPLDTAERCRLQDADAVGRRLKLLLSTAGPKVVVGEDDVPRRARGGDVAILFRRFTYLETYRQALIRHGVPHRVVRGRGFYGAQEVLDLASLLALIADPYDAIALAAVLRSPLVALADSSLFQVAWDSGQRLALNDLEARLPSLPADQAARLQRFLTLFPRLRKERDRLGIRVLLQLVLEETGYPVAVAGTPYGEQALANIDKLLELAGRRDAAGAGDCARFARELVTLAEAEPNEAQADVLDAGDPRAVQLLTIHRAKGLEWPIVVVPDMSYRGRPPAGRIVFERRLGLAIKPWLSDELEATPTERHLKICAELGRREHAEAARTLYVALTRARDQLILSGQSQKPVNGSWRQITDALIDDDPQLRTMVRDVFVEEIAEPPPPPPLPSAPPAESTARVRHALARVRQPAPIVPKDVVLPVTQLQDFFLCPRRYLYAHEVGLSEHPMVFEREEQARGEGEAIDRSGARGDPRMRGTLAHTLLERVDLDRVLRGGPELRSHLAELLWVEGESAKDKGNQEILEQVEAFLSTKFAAGLAKAGPLRVHRELPFLLRLGGRDGFALHVKGKIDLLFEADDGSALVVDYKFSRRHPAGLDPYNFQLDCYALAARGYVKEGVPVRTGIAFLKDGRMEPELRPASSFDPAAFGQTLVDGARSLLSFSRDFDWPGLPRPTCQQLRCGYQYRCHPQSASADTR